jgi:hypothetical protein
MILNLLTLVFSLKKTIKTTIIGAAWAVCRVKNRLIGDFWRFYALKRNKLLEIATRGAWERRAAVKNRQAAPVRS